MNVIKKNNEPICYRRYFRIRLTTYYLKKNCKTSGLFMGSLIPSFCTSSHLCSRFQSQSGSLSLRALWPALTDSFHVYLHESLSLGLRFALLLLPFARLLYPLVDRLLVITVRAAGRRGRPPPVSRAVYNILVRNATQNNKAHRAAAHAVNLSHKKSEFTSSSHLISAPLFFKLRKMR